MKFNYKFPLKKQNVFLKIVNELIHWISLKTISFMIVASINNKCYARFVTWIFNETNYKNMTLKILSSMHFILAIKK